MLSKTIANNLVFVISLSALISVTLACGPGFARRHASEAFHPPKVVGNIANPDIREASGITASKCQPNAFWTHNDSGDDAFVFAIGTAGENLGTWRVRNAQNVDWEDISSYRDKSGKCFIYIAEIGDNEGRRQVHSIYRIPEPKVSDASRNTTRKDALESEESETTAFSYADSNHDAETMMVHPATGDIYVITKTPSGPAGVYKIAPAFGANATQSAQRIAELKVPSMPLGLLTGGDISPDGWRVVLCDYVDGYELTLPRDAASFDDIWRQQPVAVDLGKRDTGEAVCYGADSSTIFATTEKKKAPIIEVRRKQPIA